MKLTKKQNRFLYIYYALLILILATRVDATTEPSLILRLVYILAVIAPTLVLTEVSYPAIISLFFVLTLNGFAYSYMPYNLSLYVIITLVVILIFITIKKQKQNKPIPIFLVIITIYVFSVDLVNGTSGSEIHLFQNNFYCFFLIVCFLWIARKNEKVILSQLPLCFAISTIILSILFLIKREQFILDTLGGIDRTGWTDPNYFGMVLGMGTICGLIKLFNIDDWKRISLLEKLIYIVVIVLSFPVLLLNASRGAVLSVIVGFVLLFSISKANIIYKVIVLGLSIAGIYYLYSNQYFDLLLVRMEADDGTGSNRLTIWRSKISAYSEGNLLQMIFGYGQYKGFRLWNPIGFHNDYVGYLVDYGIVGISMLLYMFYYPISIVPKKSKMKPSVIVIIVYLMVCMATLEPFIMGILPYFVFYLYALIMAQQNETLLKIKKTSNY